MTTKTRNLLCYLFAGAALIIAGAIGNAALLMAFMLGGSGSFLPWVLVCCGIMLVGLILIFSSLENEKKSE